MNYPEYENTKDWKVEDLVIHDCDAKTERMLMRVIGISKLGLIRTIYVCEELGRTIYENEKKYLLDPRHFKLLDEKVTCLRCRYLYGRDSNCERYIRIGNRPCKEFEEI